MVDIASGVNIGTGIKMGGWIIPVPPTDFTDWTTIANGNDTFVAVTNAGDTGTDYITTYSTDGINWTEIFCPIQHATQVLYAQSKFVMVGKGGTACYSTTGTSWTSTTISADTLWWQDMAYGNGLFVAVATSLSGVESNTYATSPDGIIWSLRSFPSSAAYSSITFGNGKFVVCSSGGSSAVSTTGTTWSAPSVTSSLNNSGSLTYGNGYYVAAKASRAIVYSTDGLNWTNSPNLPTPTTGGFEIIRVNYINDKFVATGFYTSITPNQNNVLCYSYSPNGNWYATELPSNAIWLATGYGTVSSGLSPVYVALGYVNSTNSTVSNSRDGVVWF